MKFEQVLLEKVKRAKLGHKRLAKAAGGDATPGKVDKYLDKVDKQGTTDKLEKQARKKGLKGKNADAYKWAVLHKMMKGHFN